MLESVTNRCLDIVLERMAAIRCAFVLLLSLSIGADGYLMTDVPFHGLYMASMILCGCAFFHAAWVRVLLAGAVGVLDVQSMPVPSLVGMSDVQSMPMPPLVGMFLLQWLLNALVAEVMAGMIKMKVRERVSTLNLMQALAKSLDSRDAYTANHSENVARFAYRIAMEMKLPKKECDAVFIGARLHDIGKIGVPERILTKPARLTDKEFDIIQNHPVIGYETVKHISHFQQNGVLDMILFHHERYDGTGYPYGIRGKQIPRGARIIALADSMDAMISNRVYRKKRGLEEAIQEVKINRGKQFDPEVVDALLSMLEREGGRALLTNLSPEKPDWIPLPVA
ncbi:HD-GYP domain-containing protein [Gorillibacterium sp. sgz5001074]|uniref:HD-GYP domain-containing protein n=1 Tax=Gorillibacterium sp. sgz5001074 TaxID=3446695 RepID=UPI003F66E431